MRRLASQMSFRPFQRFLIAFLVTATSQARIAKIRWEEVPLALRYELRILQGGEEIVKTITEGNTASWRGPLAPGYYIFQVRAIDRENLAGEWTRANLILVKPNAAQLFAPQDQSQLRLTEKEGRLFLRWRPMGKRVRYVVEIKTDSGKTQKTILEKGEYEIETPLFGLYQWRVTPLIQAEGSVEKTDLGNYEPTILGAATKWREFELQLDSAYLKAKQRFKSPAMSLLPERLPVPFGNRVSVGWKPVEGAEAYEVIFTSASKSTSRDPSSNNNTVTTLVVSESQILIPVESGKRYEVVVRALSHIDKRGVANIVSPEAKQTFEIDNTVAPPNSPFLFYVRGSVAPYTGTRVSPSTGYSGKIQGAGAGIEIGTRNFWSPFMQSDLSLFEEFQEVNGQNDLRSEIKLFTHYLWRFFGSQSGWLLRAGAGLGLLGHTVISPSSALGTAATPGSTRSRFSTVNFIPSLELEKQLTQAVSLCLDFKVPLLLGVSGPAGTSGVSATPFNNYRLSLGLHWDLGDHFIFDALMGRENRSLKYQLNGVTGEESLLTATRLGIGLSYSW